MSRSSRLLLAALPLFALAGCIKLGTKPPAQLLTLSAPSEPTTREGQEPKAGRTIELTTPNVPRKLATPRVPVQTDDTSIAYVKDAQWVDMPRILFNALLTDTLSSADLFVIDHSQPSIETSRRLTGDLLDFGIDARSKKAIVTYEATLIVPGESRTLRRRFSAEVPVRKINAKHVATPISEAAHKVATEVTEWVKEN